jgi:hypothetical protein
MQAVTETPAGRTRIPVWLAIVGGLLFALLATANGASYRYGVSDQAFYIPVVIRALDPAAFPRDAALIDAQGRHMVLDELVAAGMRATGASSIDNVFFAGYLLTVTLLWAGIVLIGTRVYASPWAIAALGAAATLRHRIPRTSANSFEPYFHPRMLAFAIGLLATAALLRRRPWLAIALVALAAVVHITTAMWFAVLLGVALAVLDQRMRRMAVAVGVLGVGAALWAAATGRLAAALTPMDDVWLQAVASKDSLFATEWPLWAWAANLGLLALLWWAHRRRTASGAATSEDAALVWGATALVALFVVTLPLVAARLALPVQLQIPRVFWLVDFVATVYVIDAVFRTRRTRLLAIALVVIAVARGGYIMLVEQPDRPLFALHSPASSWHDAMRWVAAQPHAAHVLADPGHAWKYGTSVRVSGAHDVFLEEVKDSAIAMYSRAVARRVVGRTTALGDFATLTADKALALSQQFGLDYLVTEADLPLPVAYRNQQFRVYALTARSGT